MNKLSELKEWLTLEDAAKRLSASAKETANEADILRFALDGHLTLSVYFVNHARGRPVRIEKSDPQPEILKEAEEFLAKHSKQFILSEAETKEFSELIRTYRGELLPSGTEVLIFEGDEQNPEVLEGVWDLLMLGAEKLDVEHAYQNLTGGPAVDLVCLGGPLIASTDRSKVFQLLSSYTRGARPTVSALPAIKPKISKETRKSLDFLNAILGTVKVKNVVEDEDPRWDYETVYHPAAGLPVDSVFVVRTSAMRELERKLLPDGPEAEKPLHPSERKSVSQIIAALAAMAELDLSAPYAADETLRAAAATFGLELPSSPETVVKFLKAAGTRPDKN